jgi:hypothetical protein
MAVLNESAGTTAQTVEQFFDAEAADVTDLVAVTSGAEDEVQVMVAVYDSLYSHLATHLAELRREAAERRYQEAIANCMDVVESGGWETRGRNFLACPFTVERESDGKVSRDTFRVRFAPGSAEVLSVD